jgi:hypothetical protein
MKDRLLAALLFLSLSAGSPARETEPLANDVQLGMLVTGHVDIAADGTVRGYTLTKPERLPDPVRLIVGNMISAMEFEPLTPDGVGAQTRNKVSVRVVAREGADGSYQLQIQSAHFSPAGSEERVRSAGPLRAPPFPKSASGASGTVYLILKVGPDGRVQDAVAEQVNLRTSGDPVQMQDWRNDFAASATKAALRWRFVLPEDMASRKPFVSLRVPVDFSAPGRKSEYDKSMYGKWVAYIPGPRVRAPWLDSAEDFPDLSDGSISLVDEERLTQLPPPKQSIIGEVTDVDCTASVQTTPTVRRIGRAGAELAIKGAADLGGQRAGQAAVGGWLARSMGGTAGGALGRRVFSANDPAKNWPLPAEEFRCLISLRSGDDTEIDAVFIGPSEPTVGATVRVHRQADGSYANTYED